MTTKPQIELISASEAGEKIELPISTLETQRSVRNHLLHFQLHSSSVMIIQAALLTRESNEVQGLPLQLEPVFRPFGGLISGVHIQWLEHEALHACGKGLQQVGVDSCLHTLLSICLVLMLL